VRGAEREQAGAGESVKRAGDTRVAGAAGHLSRDGRRATQAKRRRGADVGRHASSRTAPCPHIWQAVAPCPEVVVVAAAAAAEEEEAGAAA
jgi:hypothetical protein